MPLVDDFTVTTRIVRQDASATGTSSRAGLMAAEGIALGTAYAWTARYADGTGQIRAAINGNAKSAISGLGSSTLPVWVSIEREGEDEYRVIAFG